MSDEFSNNGVVEEGQSAVSEKKKVTAALLCFFLGGIGVHRFYLGRTGSGVAMLILSLVGLATTTIFIGFALLSVVGVWQVVDFIRILCNSLNDSQERKLV
jgi:TM2 domain-containing membrane protein YozV